MDDLEAQVYAVLLKHHHWFSVEDLAFEFGDPPSLLLRRNIQKACTSLYTKGLVNCGNSPRYYKALTPHEIAERKCKKH